jgi:hypothetical protein
VLLPLSRTKVIVVLAGLFQLSVHLKAVSRSTMALLFPYLFSSWLTVQLKSTMEVDVTEET